MHNDSIYCQLWRSRVVPTRSARYSVLVVDDDQASADAIATFLNLENFDVWVAYDSLAAVDLFGAVRTDLMVLDISMPVHDGFHVAQMVRELPVGRDVAIVAHTAFDATVIRSRADSANFDGYCQKGTAPSHLVGLLHEFL